MMIECNLLPLPTLTMSTRFFENLSIGQRIKYMREQRKYTQVELAKKAGVGQAAISNLETDSSRKPSAPTLLRLAAALDCNPNWFLDGIGDPSTWQPVTKDAEAEVLARYRKMSPEARVAFLAFMKTFK